MTKWVGAVPLLIISAVMVGACSTSEGANDATTTNIQSDAVNLPVGAVSHRYAIDRKQADQDFAGHQLNVDGDVATMPVKTSNLVVVRAHNGDSKDYLDLVFTGDMAKRAATLGPGRMISASCLSVDSSASPVILAECNGLAIGPRNW